MVLWQDVATGNSLLKAEGRPNEDISDHLPLLFRLRV